MFPVFLGEEFPIAEHIQGRAVNKRFVLVFLVSMYHPFNIALPPQKLRQRLPRKVSPKVGTYPADLCLSYVIQAMRP